MDRFKVEVQSTGEHFCCSKDENLLQGMERFRVGTRLLTTIPVGCRGGGCGMCKIRIVVGDFITGKMSKKHIPESEERQGYTLACRSFPRSDLIFDVET
ncbi:MAG: 2Fe-2S iron-sulfur cluster-binding protein [Pseudomonadales bacterium]